MRKAIVHEVAGPDKDGRQRCVMCAKVLAGKPEDEMTERQVFCGPNDRPSGVDRFWSNGKVTELDDLLIAGDDSGSPVPHEPCVKLTPPPRATV